MMSKRSPLFYGWIIVGITVSSTTLVYGMRHSFSIFFPYILAEFGWPRGSTAGMLSLSILVYGFMAPVAGTLSDHWRPRMVLIIGITLLGVATAACAFAQKLWHFYTLFGILMPIGMTLSGWPVLGPALANWFALRRGLVFGLGQLGLGLSFVYVILIEFIISGVGWRHAYFALAGIFVGFLLPLAVFLFHHRPEEKGLIARGKKEISALKSFSEGAPVAKESSPVQWSFKNAIKTYQLWCLVASFFLFWGIGHYLVLAHQIKFAEDIGYSIIFAASVFAQFGLFAIFGYASGFISDGVGREIPIGFSAILSILALVFLLSIKDTSHPFLLSVYAACFGYAGGLFSSTVFAGAADLFHGKHYGSISNLLLTGMGLGGAIGPWLGGHIHDITGSYRPAFVLCMISYFFSFICFWIAAPRRSAQFRAKL